MSIPYATPRPTSRPTPRRRAWRHTVLLATTALLAACGSGDAPATTAPPDPAPSGDPGAPGVYRLNMVDGRTVPATILDEQVGPTHLRGEITSGIIHVKSDGSYVYEQRSRMWNNGVLVIDDVDRVDGTWQLVGDGELRLSANGATRTVLRTWYTLTEQRQTVVGGTTGTMPFIYVRD